MTQSKSQITTLLRSNSIFLSLSLVLIVALGLALLYVPKGDLHLLLCDRHTPARDIFYRYYTQVAEWFPYALCAAILLFGRLGDGLFASACQAFSALTTQLIKHILVAPRPLTWFAEHRPDVQLPLTDGVTMNYWLSFPSGHTTSFFALALALSILLSTRMPKIPCILVQIVLFALAALGGYSRIYLSQHFTADVFGGMIVGCLITIVCYVVFYRFEDRKWYNYRVFTKK
ncbi:MAG: phosphatase PAP2 family protein [Paludibacteraceae bacterium]|nr:phosphatase PAP2 family protein [Paludibacteraceae bacterium]